MALSSKRERTRNFSGWAGTMLSCIRSNCSKKNWRPFDQQTEFDSVTRSGRGCFAAGARAAVPYSRSKLQTGSSIVLLPKVSARAGDSDDEGTGYALPEHQGCSLAVDQHAGRD